MIKSLRTVLQARAEARERLHAAAEALERGRTLAAERSAIVERYTETARASTSEHAEALARWASANVAGAPPLAVMDATATVEHARAKQDAAAVAQAVTKLTEVRNSAARDLERAEVAVQAAVHEFATAEIRAEFEAFKGVLADFQQRRLRLLGVCMAMPSALRDREWLEVDAMRSILSAEAMGIGLPLVGFSLQEAFPDPRPGRAHIDRAEVDWNEHIATLKRGDGVSVEQVRDAA